MISGARRGRPGWFRRLVADAAAHTATTFVVPGPEIARAYGLDLEGAGLRLVATPRQASVLVVAGTLPPRLAEAAAVVYAQMPRPRAILALGASEYAPLPAPDVAVALEQEALVAGVARLRALIADGGWAAEAPPHDAPPVRPPDGGRRGGTDHTMHRHSMQMADSLHMDHHGQGERPPEEEHGTGMAHGDLHHEQHGDTHHEHDEGHHRVQHSGHGEMARTSYGPHDHMDHTGSGHDGHTGAKEHGGGVGEDHTAPMQHGEQGGREHGGMGHDMHMGGFMSMVEMTKDLPRSTDGLPMEWVEAPFGPLFPALPGGLALTLTLDGDTVARVARTPDVVHRDLARTWSGPLAGFPNRLARLDPLAPVAYRLLALRALEAVAGAAPSEETALARIGALERERAASHLNWLASLGYLLGARQLAADAAALHRALLRAADTRAVANLRPWARALVRRMGRTPLLARRLRGIGGLDAATTDLRGPVARAAALARDLRAEDDPYRALGFVPIVRRGGDALSRLEVRLAEVEQSLELIARAGALGPVAGALPPDVEGSGVASLEAARGTATLRLEVRGGHVTAAVLDTPSGAHAGWIAAVAEGRELADALVGVASLDLSPWEIDR